MTEKNVLKTKTDVRQERIEKIVVDNEIRDLI